MSKTRCSVLLLALVCAAGCEKPPGAVTEEKKQVQSSEGFAKEYEDWKARAVKEFPDLGKTGTVMNTRFLEAAKELSDRNGEELKYPNWPYLLAVKVNSSLAAAPKPGPPVQAASASPVPASAPAVRPAELGRIYTIPELKALGALPSAAVVTGRVTKFDDIGLPPGVLSVVLDDALKCELTMVESSSIDGLVWQRNGSSIALQRQVGRGVTTNVVTLTMGQVLRVEGVFAQRRGSPVLVGTAKRD
jgi:hypothetical protein